MSYGLTGVAGSRVSGAVSLAVLLWGGAEAAAEQAAEGGRAFEAGHAADGGDGFGGSGEQIPGGGELDFHEVLVGGGPKTIAEHAEEMLAVKLRFFGHGFEQERRGIVGVDPFAGPGKSFKQLDAGGAPGDRQVFGGSFCGESLAGQIQQDIADHGIGLQGAERAATVAKADQPFEAILKRGIHGVSAFQPNQVGFLFAQGFINGLGPEEEEKRLGFGAGQPDRQAAALVDDQVLSRVKG